MMRCIRLGTIAVACLLTAAASGCSSSTSGPGQAGGLSSTSLGGVSSPPVSASSASSQSTVTVTETRTSTPPAPSGPAACPNGLVIVSLYQAPTQLHQNSGLTLEFRLPHPSATASCTLYGYPGVDAHFKCPPSCHNATVVSAVRTPRGYFGGLASGSNTPKTVVLSSTTPAFAVVEGPSAEPGGVVCEQFDALTVTPPNTFKTTNLPLNPALLACGVDVHPVTTHPNGNG